MSNLLWNKVNYTADIEYIISSYIREYDIKKANINILYNKGVLTKNQYEYYHSLEKKKREVSIGCLLRDNPQYNKVLIDGIKEYKQKFFEANNIKFEEVLSIKNDAVFIINKIPNITVFDNNVEFVNKNIFTSYYKLGPNKSDIEAYYYYDMVNNTEKIDIKGIKDEKIYLHEDYFLEFLKVCFCSAQSEGIKPTIDLISSFYNRYINLQLDIGYYREFRSDCCYTLKGLSQYSIFKSFNLEEHNKQYVNIIVNLNIIRQLHKYFSQIYFSNSR